MKKDVEYRVRKITRWIVTRYEETEHTGTSSVVGYFDAENLAHETAAALFLAEDSGKSYMDDVTDVDAATSDEDGAEVILKAALQALRKSGINPEKAYPGLARLEQNGPLGPRASLTK